MRKRKDKILLAGIITIFSVAAFGQQARPISLPEAISLGLQNSQLIKISEAKIKEAEANVEEAKNRQLPDFKLSGTYMRLTGANVDFKAAQNSQQQSSSENKQQAAIPKVNQAMYGSANLSWPVFAGGRIRYGIESSKYLLEAAKLSEDNDRNAIVYNISQAYTNLFKASQVIKVIDQNLQAARQRDSQYLKLENNGIIPRNDRLKAQLQTSQIELQLLEAESNYNVANTNMDLLLGIPQGTKLAVDSSFLNAGIDQKELLYYENEALQNRNDVQANAYRQRAAALGVKAAKAEELPTLALTGGYMAVDIPKVLTVTNAINAGVGVQYNLANLWKKNSNLKKAEAQEAQLFASQSLLADNIRLEVSRDYENALLSQRKIEVYQKALDQSEENYRIVKNKYDNGLATITDVLDANAARYSAQINIANAKADAALSYQKLLQSTGIINKQNNI